jgi:flagellar biosynthesis protein FlhB
MTDSGERTENATDKRMKEVREKGKLSTSKDLVAWIAIAAAAAMVPATVTATIDATSASVRGFKDVIAHPDPAVALQALGTGLGSIIPALTPMFVVVLIAVIAGTAVQGGIHIKKLAPKFEQFNLVNGLKHSFGMQAIWEGVKALLKTVILGAVLYSVIQGLLPVLTNSGALPLDSILTAGGGGVSTLTISAIGAGLAIAAVDVFVIIQRNRKQTRMTKKEVKDEHKSSDGDPLVKGQRRSRQLALGRSRMIAAVSSADVVLLNPTHIAVAIKYEPGKSAPRVVAKGADAVAARIREKATENNVPMVHDIPLARALHASCEVGQEIPAELYSAVARILAFVMSLKARGSARGVHRLAPSTI